MQAKTAEETVKFAQDAIEEVQSRLNQQQFPPFNNTPEQIIRKFFSDQGMIFNEDGIKQVIASVNGTAASTPKGQPEVTNNE